MGGGVGGCRRLAETAEESGEAWLSGKKMAVEMWVRECERKDTRRSRMLFKLKRGHSER
jgi:hypothetical protein